MTKQKAVETDYCVLRGSLRCVYTNSHNQKVRNENKEPQSAVHIHKNMQWETCTEQILKISLPY